MSEELKRISTDISNLKTVMLQDKNIDILLYLAKYNPNITAGDIAEKFGKSSLRGLSALMNFCLVTKKKERIFLTKEGIFQVEGLLTLAV